MMLRTHPAARLNGRGRDLRRGAASALVVLLVGLFITGDLTSGDLALAHPVERPSNDRTVTVYGRISGDDGPYRVLATHWRRGRIVVDAQTTTASDGTYSLDVRRDRCFETIRVIGASGKERASRIIWLNPWFDYRVDGRLRFRLKLWTVPVFGY